MGDQWYRSAFGAHYPLLYAHRNEAEAALCLDLLPRLAKFSGTTDSGSHRILDLGCGDGRHLAQLAEGAVPVIGLDLSPSLLQSARTRLRPDLNASLVRGDMLRLPFQDGVFSAVLSLFTAFGYFGSLEENRPFLAEVSRVLASGGHWYLDYLNADRVRNELADRNPVVRVREVGPFEVTESRALSAAADRVVKTVEIVPLPNRLPEAADMGIQGGGLRYEEQVALFEISELDEMAVQSGLEPVAQAGSYQGGSIDQGDRWILVYRRVRSAGSREALDAD